jgi:DNA polymerase-3 subunit alpha
MGNDTSVTDTSVINDGDTEKFGGIITHKSVKYTKAENKPFCFLSVEDMYGTVEVIVFSIFYEKFGARLQTDQVLVIQGRISAREEEATKLVAQDFLFYEEMPPVISETKATKKATFWVKVPKGSSVRLAKITSTLSAYPGETQVMIYNEEMKKKFLADSTFWVTPCNALQEALENLLGKGTVKITQKE